VAVIVGWNDDVFLVKKRGKEYFLKNGSHSQTKQRTTRKNAQGRAKELRGQVNGVVPTDHVGTF
jgi:hypothetical protein